MHKYKSGMLPSSFEIFACKFGKYSQLQYSKQNKLPFRYSQNQIYFNWLTEILELITPWSKILQ